MSLTDSVFITNTVIAKEYQAKIVPFIINRAERPKQADSWVTEIWSDARVCLFKEGQLQARSNITSIAMCFSLPPQSLGGFLVCLKKQK